MALPRAAGSEFNYSLTADYYTDPAVFAAERERIFFRTWQRVGHGEQARAPGDVLQFRVRQSAAEVGSEPKCRELLDHG